MFLYFKKDGFPEPINLSDEDDRMEDHRWAEIISAMLSRPDLVESNLTRVDTPAHRLAAAFDSPVEPLNSPHSRTYLARWAADAVAASCLFSIEQAVHLHSAFVDLCN